MQAVFRGSHSFLTRVRSFALTGRLQVSDQKKIPLTIGNNEPGCCWMEAQTLGLNDHFEDFGHSYQALWLCLLNLAIFNALSVIAFSFVFEKWSIVDSLYFSTVTFTTVGYGDLSPSTVGGQIFTIFFAIYGITILGAFLGLAGQVIIERNNVAIELARKEVQASIIKTFATSGNDVDSDEASTHDTLNEDKSLMKEIFDLLVSGIPVVALLLGLAITIARAESWNFMTGIYWIAVTACTVGYGDLTPKRTSVRLLCIILIPLAVVATGSFLTRVAGVYIARRNRQARQRFLSRSLTLSNLAAMDADNDGQVSIEEFLSFMLVALQKVEKREIDQLTALFHKLDRSGDRYLDKNDLMQSYLHVNTKWERRKRTATS